MKKYMVLFVIFFSLVLTSSVKAECPPATSAIWNSQTFNGFYMLFYDSGGGELAGGRGGEWSWGLTFYLNDAAVLIDSDGNVVPSLQNVEAQAGTYTFKVISSGEYFACGGGYDSPPITFGNKPVYYENHPATMKSWGGGPAPPVPRIFDSVYCTNSMITVSDNDVPLQTFPSSDMTEFSFYLDEGTHNIQVTRAIDCKYSFYGTAQVYVHFGPGGFVLAESRPLAAYSSITIPKSNSKSPPLTYNLDIAITGAGTCKDGCTPGFICCEKKCRDASKGSCVDIDGDGIPDWVPYS